MDIFGLAQDLKYYRVPTSALCDQEPEKILRALGASTVEALIQEPDRYHRQALRYLFFSVGGSGRLVEEALGFLLQQRIEPCSYLRCLIQGAARRNRLDLLDRFPRVEPVKRVYWQTVGSQGSPGSIIPDSREHHLVLRGLVARGEPIPILREYLRSHPVRGRERWEEILSETARRGFLPVLRWFLEDCGLRKYLDSRELVTHLAARGAKGGSEEVVEYMRTYISFPNKSVLSYAIEGGHENLVSTLLGSNLARMYPDGIISFVGFRNYKVLIELLLEKGANPTFFPRILLEGDELEMVQRIGTLISCTLDREGYLHALNVGAATSADLGRPRLLHFFLRELGRLGGSPAPSLPLRAIPGGHLECLQLALYHTSDEEVLRRALEMSYRYRHPSLQNLLRKYLRDERVFLPTLSLRSSEDLVPLIQLWSLEALPDEQELLRFFLHSVFERLNRCRAWKFQDWTLVFSPIELSLLNTLSEGLFPDFSRLTSGSVSLNTSSKTEPIPFPWNFFGSSLKDPTSNRILSPPTVLRTQITAFVSGEPVPKFRHLSCRVVRPPLRNSRLELY